MPILSFVKTFFATFFMYVMRTIRQHTTHLLVYRKKIHRASTRTDHPSHREHFVEMLDHAFHRKTLLHVKLLVLVLSGLKILVAHLVVKIPLLLSLWGIGLPTFVISDSTLDTLHSEPVEIVEEMSEMDLIDLEYDDEGVVDIDNEVHIPDMDDAYEVNEIQDASTGDMDMSELSGTVVQTGEQAKTGVSLDDDTEDMQNIDSEIVQNVADAVDDDLDNLDNDVDTDQDIQDIETSEQEEQQDVEFEEEQEVEKETELEVEISEVDENQIQPSPQEEARQARKQRALERSQTLCPGCNRPTFVVEKGKGDEIDHTLLEDLIGDVLVVSSDARSLLVSGYDVQYQASYDARYSARIAAGTEIIPQHRSDVAPQDIILEPRDQGVKFGFDDSSLHFSQPVQVSFAVEGYRDGDIVPVYIEHFGDSSPGTVGLTTDPDAVCVDGQPSSPNNYATVRDGKVELYTCSASYLFVNENLWLEAECGELGANVDLVNDTNASNELAVTFLGANAPQFPTSSADWIDYAVYAQAGGTYYVWTRAQKTVNPTRRYWIEINGVEGSQTQVQVDGQNVYQWQFSTHTLVAGMNTIRLARREPNVLIDKLLITSSSSFVPTGMGGETLNCGAVFVMIEPTRTVNEGNVWSIDVALSHAFSETITVAYETVDGSAVAGVNYVAQNGVLTFAPGEMVKTITGVSLEDGVYQPDLNFDVVLQEVTSNNAQLGQSNGEVTIFNSTELPTVSLSAGDDVLEGDMYSVTVTLSHPTYQQVTVEHTTQNGSALAGQHYVASAGSLLIPAFATQGTITGMTIYNEAYDPERQFTINMTNVQHAALGTPDSSLIRIFDIDGQPSLSLSSDVTIDEGDDWEVALTLDYPSYQSIDVSYVTIDGSALSGQDYVAVSGVVTIPAGNTSVVVTGGSIDNNIYQLSRSFTIAFSSMDEVTLLDTEREIMILDNDSFPTVSVASVTGYAGNTFIFEAVLSNPTYETVELTYSTLDSTAVSGSDYLATGGVVSIPPGTLTGSFGVATVSDVFKGEDREFIVSLSQVTGATLVGGNPTGSIEDNFCAPLGDSGLTGCDCDGVSCIWLDIDTACPLDFGAYIINEQPQYRFRDVSESCAFIVHDYYDHAPGFVVDMMFSHMSGNKNNMLSWIQSRDFAVRITTDWTVGFGSVPTNSAITAPSVWTVFHQPIEIFSRIGSNDASYASYGVTPSIRLTIPPYIPTQDYVGTYIVDLHILE